MSEEELRLRDRIKDWGHVLGTEPELRAVVNSFDFTRYDVDYFDLNHRMWLPLTRGVTEEEAGDVINAFALGYSEGLITNY